jgi:drug/metabolite transporter (DMT)-like permease
VILRLQQWSLAPLGALTLGVLATLLWSGSTIAEKVLIRQIPPVSLLVWQLGVSVAVLWGLLLLSGTSRPSRQDLFRQGWPGLLQPGLANLLLLLGLALTSANTFGFLNAYEAPLGMLFASLLLGERASRPTVGLAGLATLGVLLVALNAPQASGNLSDSGSFTTLHGVLLVLCGTGLAALYGAVSSFAASAKDSRPLVLTALQQTAGLGVAVVAWCLLALPRGELGVLVALPPAVWGWAALAGVFQYAVPFWFFLLALRSLSVSAVSLLFTLGPAFVLIGAFLVLGERLSLLQACGAALTLLALGAVAWLQRRGSAGTNAI